MLYLPFVFILLKYIDTDLQYKFVRQLRLEFKFLLIHTGMVLLRILDQSTANLSSLHQGVIRNWVKRGGGTCSEKFVAGRGTPPHTLVFPWPAYQSAKANYPVPN